jgi:hypothetical protein
MSLETEAALAVSRNTEALPFSQRQWYRRAGFCIVNRLKEEVASQI